MTGSVYKDYALLKNGFPGENSVNGSVIAVKTHEFGPEALKQFDRAILLVRDPYEALQVQIWMKNMRVFIYVACLGLEKLPLLLYSDFYQLTVRTSAVRLRSGYIRI